MKITNDNNYDSGVARGQSRPLSPY